MLFISDKHKKLFLYFNSLQTLNFPELLDRIDNDIEFVDQLFEGFLNIFPTVANDLYKALDNNEPEKVASIAHRLKGEARNLSAERLKEILQIIEDSGRSGNLTGIEIYIEPLKKTCEDLMSYLKNQEWKKVDSKRPA